MANKKRCVEKATELGSKNYTKYTNCAQATFTAIIDALREEGVELTSVEAENAIFRALSGVSGGHSNLGSGNCGALTGAASAISLVSGVGRGKQIEDKDYRWIAFDNITKTI
ncbi:MAG TPA: C-GCAxxG-C-C family (seleno)protein, partial [Clostridia bacterium]|nr:C-GCAxxG-C-C family (seleno)protein [Clostridia bacterium]